MKITGVEAIQLNPRLAARNADKKVRFAGIDTQTLYRVTTDNGIVGSCDGRGHASLPDTLVDRLVDANPFDFIYASLPTGLMGALYDVMGKHLEVPAYKLMGQKLRERVCVAAWTRPGRTEEIAGEVQQAIDDGYMVFKCHTREAYDVLEWTRAVEEIAPPGFKMHYDFNGNRSIAAILALLKELEESPVVGYIEDPVKKADPEGWAQVRGKSNLPLIHHQPPLGVMQEVLARTADAYMIEVAVDVTLKMGFAVGAANLSNVIQLTGGTLCKALALHMGAVLPNMLHSINLDDQLEEDVTGVRIEVESGSSPVPEAPGLGIEVDEKELARISQNPETVVPRHISILHVPGGPPWYSTGEASAQSLTGMPEGQIRGIDMETRDDDGSDEFATLYDDLKRTGPRREER